jgi:hypothetical protein
MALIEKLKSIANAIRSKTNKSEEMTLEQMASEVSGIDVMQGLDFGAIYDQEQANEINQYYKNGIAYAEKIKAENPNPSGLDMRYKFQNDTQLVFFPNLDISQVTSLLGVCMGAVNLIAIPPLDIDNVTTIEQSFRDTNIKQLTLRNAQKCTKWTNILYLCSSIEILHISGWKQGNIAILQSNLLSPESIDNAIENAIDVIDGAEEGRTLQLHATAGANWDANSKYQGEERKLLLTQKGIEVTW